MALLGFMTVFVVVVWSGCTVEVQGAPVTVAPTDNLLPYITTEEANKVLLEDLTELLGQLTDSKNRACNSLKLHCESMTAGDILDGMPCEEFAEVMGTRHMTCTRPITTPEIHNGIDRTLETTVQELFASIAGHNAMLNGLLSLPTYISSEGCSSVSATSPEYFICRLQAHVRYNNRTNTILEYLLSDLESDNLPGSVSCVAKPSVSKTAPLGVLWKISNDNDTHEKNVRAICEYIKSLQNNSELSCV